MGTCTRLLGVAALLVLAFLAWTPARAADLPVCLVKLDGNARISALMAQPDRFDCTTRQSLHGPGDFLAMLRFAPVQAGAGDPLVFRTTSVWQDSARIHFRYADGGEETVDYSSRDASRFMTIGAIFEFPVPRREAALQAIFVETRGSANLRGAVLGAQLMARSESFALKTKLTVLYAAFAGMTLALIVYNLSLWAALRHRFQLIYAAMAAVLGCYMFTASGTLMIVAPEIANNDRLRLNYVLLTLSGVMAFVFLRNFFDDRIFRPRIRVALKLTIWLSLASTLAFAVLAPWQISLIEKLHFASQTAMLSMVFPVLWSAWRNRSRYLWAFVLAWIAPIVVSYLRASYGFNLIGYSIWLDNGNLIAFSIEALLSSLMVTMRVRELSIERDTAVAGEQVARRLASTDPLTGLLNRRAFLDLAIGRKGRHRLMLIDIDNFKLVNDRLGHERGDEVLRAVAGAIQRCRPARSLAVRLGGEEFALLVPRSAFADCTADTLLDAVRGQAMPMGARVTVSIGFADGALTGEDAWKRLYRLADSALYRAKSDGRDRACRATDFREAA